jgi:hypothetical protein
MKAEQPTYDFKNEMIQLYPVLVDADGNLIDGSRRLEADPNWKKVTIPEIKGEYDRLVYDIIANTRRIVTQEERATKFTKLANILKSQGMVADEIPNKIANDTGFGGRYVRQLLPRDKGLKREQKEWSSTPPDGFDEPLQLLKKALKAEDIDYAKGEPEKKDNRSRRTVRGIHETGGDSEIRTHASRADSK